LKSDSLSVLSSTWYAKPDDLIGGWCVMPVDCTPAEAPKGIAEVASFVYKEVAEHMAAIHNEWLTRVRDSHDILRE
jgi:hypothetical protein